MDRQEIIDLIDDKINYALESRGIVAKDSEPEKKPEPIKPEVGMVGWFSDYIGIGTEHGTLVAVHDKGSTYRYISANDRYECFTPDDPQPEPKIGDFGKFWDYDEFDCVYGYLGGMGSNRYQREGWEAWLNFRPCLPPAHIDIEER
ncbi:MAG: hypothetical protein PVJ39_04625 [Gammaproteobacteria bacterium]|jgi:hypothetical protein